jgi:hypothetical protein
MHTTLPKVAHRLAVLPSVGKPSNHEIPLSTWQIRLNRSNLSLSGLDLFELFGTLDLEN